MGEIYLKYFVMMFMAKFLLPATLVRISPNALQGSSKPLMTVKGDLFIKAGGTIPGGSDAEKVNILLTAINTYIRVSDCTVLLYVPV